MNFLEQAGLIAAREPPTQLLIETLARNEAALLPDASHTLQLDLHSAGSPREVD